MAIISTLRNLFRRHKKKLIISTTILSVIYLFQKIISYKIGQYRKSINQENFAREQIRRRFEQTQKDSIFTILSLIPVLSKPIYDILPVEIITQTLKNKKNKLSDSTNMSTNLSLASEIGNEALEDQIANVHEYYSKKTKVELWTDLKITSITRILTIIYSISLLILLTRLQLNILARRSYLETALNLATSNYKAGTRKDDGINEDFFSEQSYLSLSWWLLNKGLVKLVRIIENKVTEVFHPINVRTEMSLAEFNSLIVDVVSSINEEFEELCSCCFPLGLDEQILTLDNTTPEFISHLYNYDSTLKVLIDETTRYIVSNQFQLVLSKLVGNSLHTLAVNMNNNLNNGTANFKLASILAQVTVQSNVIVTNEPLGEYLNAMDDVVELDELSAAVYSNFEDV